MATSPTPILTFGYGKRSLDECLGLLREHAVEYVVDVRSAPYSRFKPEFSKDPLRAELKRHGIRYVFMGEELGGRPDDPTCYDEDGRVDYLACRGRPAFVAGIDRLRTATAGGHRVALMCSEGRPEDCHRTKLVADFLLEQGVPIAHIDERDRVCTHDEVLDRLRGNQLNLLGVDDPEVLHKSRGQYAKAVES